jgi:succinate dehydrogenase/fumarate reductase flavoprotein subunit
MTDEPYWILTSDLVRVREDDTPNHLQGDALVAAASESAPEPLQYDDYHAHNNIYYHILWTGVSTPMSFHATYDLVVVGFGGAGSAAAIEAADLGARVLVVEKMATGGGSTCEAAGSIRTTLDRNKALVHLRALTEGKTPDDVLLAYIDGLADLPEWVKSLGGLLADIPQTFHGVFPAPSDLGKFSGSAFPGLEGAEGLGTRLFVTPTTPGMQGGEALFRLLERNVRERRIDVWYDSPAQSLVLDDADGVVGLEVQHPDGVRRVEAKAGVVLCCGGFNYDPRLQKEYLGAELPALSPPGRNTGDGIRIAQRVGADLWHMTAMATCFGYKFDDVDAGFWMQLSTAGFIFVDQTGRRYVNEYDIERHMAHLVQFTCQPTTGAYIRLPSYVIFDDKQRRAGPITMLLTGHNRNVVSWSQDNSTEVEKGWITRAASIGELANKLHVEESLLQQSVDDYNSAALAGAADSFGREPGDMIPIDTGPFYAAAVWPVLINTQGGPRRNGRSEVLRPDGSPIPGLFSAGELGSMWTRLYPGAGNVSEALVFGRIAARTAMKRLSH